MGRTGRKRVGSVLILLTEGRERESYKRALDNYAVMQKKIASGSDFTFQHDLSPRIIPKDIDPQPDKKHIDIPIENSQAEPEKKRRVKKKAPPKKFFMPDGVKTGFTKASRIHKGGALSTDSSGGESGDDLGGTQESEPLAPQIDVNSQVGLLTEEEEAVLERNYKQTHLWDQSTLVVDIPELHRFPEVQRSLTKTRHVSHGNYTKRIVKTLRRVHDMNDKTLERLKNNYDPELLKSPKKTTAFKPVRPAVRKPTATLKEKTANRGQEDSDVEITHVKPTAKKPAPRTKGSGMFKKRPTPPSSDGGDVASKKAKKQKVELDISSDGEEEMRSSDSELLPDPKDLLKGFRWAGTGRKVGRRR